MQVVVYNIHIMQDSIFTKIINGEIPGEVIYKDEKCFVILTIEPLSPGHMLVIPREQIDHIWDLPPDLYQHVMMITRKMAELIRKVYDYKRVAFFVEGFGVPHAHIHVNGLDEGIEPTVIRHATTKRNATAQELKTEADKLRAAL